MVSVVTPVWSETKKTVRLSILLSPGLTRARALRLKCRAQCFIECFIVGARHTSAGS
jgi:hypothetical protein